MTRTQNAPEEFWNTLIGLGLLSEARIDEYRSQLAQAKWRPLGKILIDEGVLTVRQVMGIVSMQADEPHMRLGDIAVREDYCSPKDIARGLAIQANMAPGPIELFMRDENISSNERFNALIRYIYYLEGCLEQNENELTAA